MFILCWRLLFTAVSASTENSFSLMLQVLFFQITLSFCIINQESCRPLKNSFND